MTEYIEAWQCIGCGRLEASRPCIGVCQDRRVQLVPVEDFEAAVERIRIAQDAVALVRLLAGVRPREGRWREGFEALQRQAQAILADAANVEDTIAGRSAASD